NTPCVTFRYEPPCVLFDETSKVDAASTITLRAWASVAETRVRPVSAAIVIPRENKLRTFIFVPPQSSKQSYYHLNAIDRVPLFLSDGVPAIAKKPVLQKERRTVRRYGDRLPVHSSRCIPDAM